MQASVRAPGIGNVFKVFTLFRPPGAAVGMRASSLLFMGQFGLFTYVRPFLETITGVQGTSISLILLAIGTAVFIGTVFIDRVLQQGFYQTLVVIPLLMAATSLALIAFGGSVAIVVALLALWGLASTSATVGWWAWIAKLFPKDAEAGGGLFVAAVQMSIAVGSTVGGLLVDHSGYRSTFVMSAVLLAACAVLTAMTARSAGCPGSLRKIWASTTRFFQNADFPVCLQKSTLHMSQFAISLSQRLTDVGLGHVVFA